MAYLQLFRNNIRNVILWLERKINIKHIKLLERTSNDSIASQPTGVIFLIQKLDPNSTSWNFDTCPMTGNVTASKQMLSPQTPCFDRPMQLLMKLSNAHIFH